MTLQRQARLMTRQFERRPLRLGRIFSASPLYFVTFCTHDRRACLASHEVHAAFVLFAQCAADKLGIAVGRYVIMPDHVHLFVRGGPRICFGPMGWNVETIAGQSASLVEKGRTDLAGRILRSRAAQ